MNRNLYILFPAILTAILALAVTHEAESGSYQNPAPLNFISNAGIFYKYFPVKDTIYITGDRYIELSIKAQTAKLIRKNDTPLVFKVSSGTDRLPKGLNTPTGIYTVQSKSPIATSKQFENCELFHWIGFNGNIGFHGLKGKGYYRSLGLHPSSHGCIRMSNEDGEILYKNVSRGTPVIVFDEEPARVPAFIDSKNLKINHDIFLSEADIYTKKMLKSRLNNLAKGKSCLNAKYKIILDGQTILRPGGFELGQASLINLKQQMPIPELERLPEKNDKLSFNQILRADSLKFQKK
jgi:hypothetical protein